MKKARFKTKIICYNLLVFTAIILLVVGGFYYWVVRDIAQRARTDFETLSGKTVGLFDTLIYNMDKTALQIAANPSIVGCFTGIAKDSTSNYFIGNPLKAGEVVRLLNSYNFKKDGNARICLYNQHSDFVYSATIMTTADGVAAYFGSADFAMVKEHFTDDNVFSMFRAPGPDILNTSDMPSPEYFSIIRQIKDYYSGTQKNGYVEVQQSVARMDEIFSNLGEACYAVVYDQRGDLIYLCPALRSDKAFEALEQIRAIQPETLPLGVVQQNQNYFSRYETEEAPLDIVFFKKASAVMKPVMNFSMIIVAALIAALTVAIISVQILARRISKPLTELTASVKNVNIDNLKWEVTDASDSDELMQLDTAFHKMLSHLSRAIDRQLVSQTNELKAHLFALQSQMNPHFIYNILAIVNMEAEIEGNLKTVTICRALSRMLSYSSSMGDGFADVPSELMHAENYLELMKQRYEETFEYTLSIDEALRDVRMPKLLVQPMCENCFKHGFMKSEQTWKISVKAMRQGELWVVEVTDNGTGVTDDFLREFEKLKKELTIENMGQKMEEVSIGGLSLSNTYMRLKLSYQENFICTIENTGCGSKVTLGGRAHDTHTGR